MLRRSMQTAIPYGTPPKRWRSEHQLSYITQSNSGEGLLFYGSVTIPFVDRFPRGEIYDLLTTKPEDAANGKQTE